MVLSQLYRHTSMQTSFVVNMLALNGGRPEQLNLKDIVSAFVSFREEVVTKRTTFLLKKARERAHILAGLVVALNNIENIIALIRAAADAVEARKGLTETEWPAADVAEFIEIFDDPDHEVIEGKYKLSDALARAILELRLQR